MRKILILLAISFICIIAKAQHIGKEYRLKKVIRVAGRQGIAIDKYYYYVSDTRALYKYDKDGNMLLKNDNPFRDPEKANHFGDIDIYNGEIYTGNEKFEYGRGYNISIDVYDARTLKWKRSIPWCAESGQVECSGLAIDREKNMVWMSDWVDSRYVYCYNLETGKYYTKMQCRPTPYWCQGIFIADGKMIFAADDGEATFQIADNLYIADISQVSYTGLVNGMEPIKKDPYSVEIKDGKVVTRTGLIPGGAKAGRIMLLREMVDFKRAGEIEGIAIDPTNDDLVVLNNRGTQIVLGMSQGSFYNEGYKAEIHELYIYEKVK